ncbi:LysR family transcriptional regulator [Advenella mimigardefordensis]|uniref:Transcriptional regulator, LysR family n=1 Tax=Advenella mimigardefordensis (strain DSM 17166 / LMG 22922 / DPN7) TaxID=1247726 RepID=W0PCW1_ADVMD|nr:LysR substrate-binding domain-containing protein [Advenella mimigardefordensis]AHG64596.1 transcriptional regulator, LysR family [Advenella mimigardefordensis DPN7]
MDLRALSYFVEVVRQNNFTRAAEALHVTQPTISKMVRALEEEFGGPLLVRNGRSIQLTDAGQVVYNHGQKMLNQAQQLRQEVAEVDGITRGTLTIGIAPTLGHYMAPVIALFQHQYPGVELQLLEQGAHALHQSILDGDLDMSVGILQSEPEPQLERYAIAHLKVCAVFPAQHSLNGAGTMSWRELQNQPLVLYTSDFVLHQTVLARCAAAGFSPLVRLQTRYWDFIGDLVAAGVGIGVLLEHVAAKFDPQVIASCPLSDPDVSWGVGLSWRSGYLSRAALAWLACVRDVYPAADPVPENRSPE